MKGLDIILGIACVIFIVSILYLIYINVRLSSDKIEPGDCPTSKGEYGITLGVSYKDGESLAILQKCGPRGNEPCTFDVSTVSDVLLLCNSFAHICNAILVSNDGKQAYIIDTNKTRTIDQRFDIFEVQL